MASVSETSSWEDEIYQIETADPVVGGSDGIANKQAKGLANRTKWLFDKVADLFRNKADKSYVDTKVNDLGIEIVAAKQGLTFKDDCRVVSVVDITLSGLLTIDGVALAEGDRVLMAVAGGSLKNGIWVAVAGEWTRATDADTASKLKPNTTIWVSEGTEYADSQWTLTNDSIVLGSSNLIFVQTNKSAYVTGQVIEAVENPDASKWVLADGSVKAYSNYPTLANKVGYGSVNNYSTSLVGELPHLTYWIDIAYGNGTWVAISGGYQHASQFASLSKDGGMTWMRVKLPVSEYWTDITFNGYVFRIIAGGSPRTSTAVLISVDGVVWNRGDHLNGGEWLDSAWNGEVYVDVDMQSAVTFNLSRDGVQHYATGATTLFSSPATPIDIVRIGASKNFMVIAGGSAGGAKATASNKYAISKYVTDGNWRDGLTWTSYTMPATAQWIDVDCMVKANGSTILCAVAGGMENQGNASSSLSNVCAYSNDNGVTFTLSTLPSKRQWYSLKNNGSVFIAVAYDSNVVAISSNGKDWVEKTLPISGQWFAIGTDGENFLLVGNTRSVVKIKAVADGDFIVPKIERTLKTYIRC